MQTSTLNKLHILQTIYQKGYQHDIADQTLGKLIELERDIAQSN